MVGVAGEATSPSSEPSLGEDDASPRSLLLSLLNSFGTAVPVQVLLRAASVFGIDENRTRVALHRLRAKGLVENAERGSYRVSGEALVLAAEDWRDTLFRLRPWEGRWVGVVTVELPRTDKTVARRRDRATRRLGLQELRPGILVRPENLVGGVDGLREKLRALGLEVRAPVFRMDELGPDEAVARGLWRSLALDAGYRAHTEALTRASLELHRLEPESAARLAFQLGGRAVRELTYDPLLPEPLVDPGLREAFVETLIVFDELARDLWARVLGTDLVLRQSPTLTGPRG